MASQTVRKQKACPSLCKSGNIRQPMLMGYWRKVSNECSQFLGFSSDILDSQKLTTWLVLWVQHDWPIQSAELLVLPQLFLHLLHQRQENSPVRIRSSALDN